MSFNISSSFFKPIHVKQISIPLTVFVKKKGVVLLKFVLYKTSYIVQYKYKNARENHLKIHSNLR